MLSVIYVFQAAMVALNVCLWAAYGSAFSLAAAVFCFCVFMSTVITTGR